MFAFAILDRDPKGTKIFLARDRLGIKPLIYCRNQKGFVFASEVKALCDAGLIDKKISYDALGQYFATGSVQQPNTIYMDVYHLLPGHYMIVDGQQQIKAQKWYDIRDEASNLALLYHKKSYQELVELTRVYLEEAAQYHVIADVEVGAFLSGGVDSAAVVALMRQRLKGRIQTFSLGYETQNEVVDERQAARESAEFIKADYHELIVTHELVRQSFDPFIKSLDQPSLDGFNTYLVSQAAAQNVKVTLSGLGGDELFGGYTYFKDILQMGKIPFPGFLLGLEGQIPLRIIKSFSYHGLSPYEAVCHFRQYHSWDRLRKITLHDFGKQLFLNNDEPELDNLSRMGLAELNGYLCSTLLRDCDVLSMAHSLEVRPILLDHKLAEHTLALPDRAKMKGARMKSVFLDAVKGLIPQSCGQRKKTGFELPFKEWMQGPLNAKFQDAFESNYAQKLFLKDFQVRTLKSLASGKLTRRDWQWFVLLSWLQTNQIDEGFIG